MVKLTQVSGSRMPNAADQAAKTQGELAGRHVNQKRHPSAVKAVVIAGAVLAVAGSAYALSRGYSETVINQCPVPKDICELDVIKALSNGTYGISPSKPNVTMAALNATSAAPNVSASTVTHQTSDVKDKIMEDLIIILSPIVVCWAAVKYSVI